MRGFAVQHFLFGVVGDVPRLPLPRLFGASHGRSRPFPTDVSGHDDSEYSTAALLLKSVDVALSREGETNSKWHRATN